MACVGLGIARNRKTPAYAEALNRCARLSELSAEDIHNADALLHRSRRSSLALPRKHGEDEVRGLPVFCRSTALAGLSVSRPSVRPPWLR